VTRQTNPKQTKPPKTCPSTASQDSINPENVFLVMYSNSSLLYTPKYCHVPSLICQHAFTPRNKAHRIAQRLSIYPSNSMDSHYMTSSIAMACCNKALCLYLSERQNFRVTVLDFRVCCRQFDSHIRLLLLCMLRPLCPSEWIEIAN
jgi:hypothetical protein